MARPVGVVRSSLADMYIHIMYTHRHAQFQALSLKCVCLSLFRFLLSLSPLSLLLSLFPKKLRTWGKENKSVISVYTSM